MPEQVCTAAPVELCVKGILKLPSMNWPTVPKPVKVTEAEGSRRAP